MLLTNGSKKEIQRKIKKISQTNKNKAQHIKNLRAATKPVLRGKFIVINADIEKQLKYPHFTSQRTRKRRMN